MQLSRKDHVGPQRVRHEDAAADLQQMRGTPSPDEVPRIVEELKVAARQVKQEQRDEPDNPEEPLPNPTQSHGDAAPDPQASPVINAPPSACAKRRRLNTPPSKQVMAGVAEPAHSSAQLAQEVSGAPGGSPSACPERRRLSTPPSKQSQSPGLCPLSAFAAVRAAATRVVLTFRGLCIQYPFSQLLLTGTKNAEVRKYPLAPGEGSRQICHPNEEMFLIETPQKGPADVGDAALPRKPVAAQVVGTVKFASCRKYDSFADFRSDQHRHRILPDSHHDWDDERNRFAWEVAEVRRFLNPIPAEGHNQIGFMSPKTLTAELAPSEGDAAS